jgi:hypothetical protein
VPLLALAAIMVITLRPVIKARLTPPAPADPAPASAESEARIGSEGTMTVHA